MKKVFFDINVILDVLLNRQPFAEDAKQCVALVSNNEIVGYLAAHAITTIEYFLSKHLSAVRVKHVLGQLLSKFDVAAIDQSILIQALNLKFADYEDAVTYSAALSIKAELILTRNTKDFKNASIRILNPSEFLNFLPLRNL